MLKKILPILILLFTLALFAQEQLATTTEYILSAGDRISIEVMDHPNFPRNYKSYLMDL